MSLPFELLSGDSKIWIYQSERNFSAEEQKYISAKLDQFLANWASHGAAIVSGYTFKHQRFVIVAIDEATTNASGCSIDKLVHFMAQLGAEMGLNLMDRNIAFVKSENIESVNISQVKYLITIGDINEQTHIFNNSITTKSALSNNWLVKASETWTSKYFKNQLV
ncbi:MAG: hypothetical protein ACKVOU_06125 [Cytophagales bacterium]